MVKDKKNIWTFKEDYFNDSQARVLSTFVEEKTLCDVKTKEKKIRFAHEFIHIDHIKQTIREFEMHIKDEKRRDALNEQELNKEQENELKISSNHS
tara:strand:+ start:1068 stop:1355 length:288 start_codon:yes stop_codon:yes gene_type:complete